MNEMRCAEEMGDRYYIVRVWGALQINEEQRVQVFRNPYELMRRKEMSLCLLV